MGNRCKLGKLRAHIAPSESYESPFIAHLVAVVRCAENGNAVAIMGYLIPIILDLQHQYFFASIEYLDGDAFSYQGHCNRHAAALSSYAEDNRGIERTGKAEDANCITKCIRRVSNELIHQQVSKMQMTSG